MATAKPVLFAGNSNLALAEEIAKKMGTRLGNALVTTFANEECRVEIRENVRGADAFVIQSLCKPPDQTRSVNDSFVEMLLMIDALRRVGVSRYRSHPVLRLCQARQENQRPRADLGQACRQPALHCRRAAHSHHRSACGADSGLFRRTGGQPHRQFHLGELPYQQS